MKPKLRPLLAAAAAWAAFAALAADSARARDPAFEGIHGGGGVFIGGGNSEVATERREVGTSGSFVGVGGQGILTYTHIPHAGNPFLIDGILRANAFGGGGGVLRLGGRGGLTLTTGERGVGLGASVFANGEAGAHWEYEKSGDKSDEGEGEEDKKKRKNSEYEPRSTSASITAAAGPSLTYIKRDSLLILQPWVGYGVSRLNHDWKGGEEDEPLVAKHASATAKEFMVGGRLKYTMAGRLDLSGYYGRGENRTELQGAVSFRMMKNFPLGLEGVVSQQRIDGKTYSADVTERPNNEQSAWCAGFGIGGTW